jgi:D-alanyl-D-alanine carboxypeptidase (penicillin-binding protein 5/6)
MAFEALKTGRVTLDQEVQVSRRAWAAEHPGESVMFLEIGQMVKITDLIQGMIVVSGNDAAIALAEALAGDEATFAAGATRRAHELGMNDSNFVNSDGLPDPNHYSTAHDLALLARHLIEDFPDRYPVFSERSYLWSGVRGNVRAQPNRLNEVYDALPGADGLKTGHTEVAGYGLTVSARRGDRRLILVLNGLTSTRQRNEEAIRLLNWGFAAFQPYQVFQRGQTVARAEVWRGQAPDVPLVLGEDVNASLSAEETVSARLILDEPVPAPIAAGQQLGELEVTLPGTSPRRYPLTAGAGVGEIGFLGRLIANTRRLMSEGG